MVKIAVVEDDDAFKDTLKSYFAKFTAEEKNNAITIKYFSDGDEIASDYDACYDVIFMDIEMKRMDGMSAAEHIRKFDKNSIIVFITNMANYAIKSYAVGATDYLLKPLSYFVFSEQLKKLIKLVEKKQDKFLFLPLENGVVKMKYDDIFFIESFKHKLFIHTVEGDYQITETMKNIEDKMCGSSLARCNNCYIVNMSHIKKITGNVIFIDKAELSISRPKKKIFMKIFSEYIGGAE